MSEVPLSVVYQKVDTKEEENIDQVSLKENTSDFELEDLSSCCKEEECCEQKKKIKNGKRKFLRKACACFGAFTTIMILIYAVLFFALSAKAYIHYKQCFHAKDNIYKESSIVDKHINQININVVTGFVHVEYEDREDIFIRVWDNAISRKHVDGATFDSGVAINNNSIIVHSKTPAFNFKTCFHANVEIYIPNSYPQELSINGHVLVGMVHIDGNRNFNRKKMAGIDITVEMGKISVEDVKTQSLSLNSDLGLIKVHDSETKSAKIQSHTGIVRTHDLIAKTLHAVSQFGCSKHYNLNADNVVINTRFGFATVDKISPLGKELDFHMNTEYGKSKILVDSSNVNFTIGTVKGQMTVAYEDEDYVCKLEKSSLTSMNGKCNALATADKTLVKLDINTKYGKTKVIVDQSIDDD